MINVLISTRYNFSYDVYGTTLEFKHDIEEIAKYSEFKYYTWKSACSRDS